MSKTFTVPTCPYDYDEKIFSCKNITFDPGLTVLVGCNGTGKTTLINLLYDQLNESGTPVMKYNNLINGGTNRISELMFKDNIEYAANMIVSSEGERIHQSLGIFASEIGHKIRQTHPKELWILMDAVGSGLSIDGIQDVKNFVDFIQSENKNTTLYIITATNEYEFAENSDCVDVTNFSHHTFRSYEEYRSFILKTAEKKKKRYNKGD